MSVTRVYPTFKDSVLGGLCTVGDEGTRTIKRQLSLAKSGVNVLSVALEGAGYDLTATVDVVSGIKSLQSFPSLMERVKRVDGKFYNRGQLKKMIFVAKVVDGLLKCGKLIGRTGLPLFAEVFTSTYEIAAPVGYLGVRVSLELSVGTAITVLSVTTIAISSFRDISKITQAYSINRCEDDGENLLVSSKHSIHLIKSAIKLSRVAIVVLGIANPALSISLILASVAVGIGYDLVKGEEYRQYCLGVPTSYSNSLTVIKREFKSL